MKKSRSAEEQRVAIMCEADHATVAEAAKKHKVATPPSMRWVSISARWSDRCQTAQGSELENSHLKKLLAEWVLDTETLKEINAKNIEPAGLGVMLASVYAQDGA